MPTVTPIYAALAGLLLVVLTFRVILMRNKFKVGVGDGGHIELERAIRAHGNFIEYTPIALLLLLISETTGLASGMVHALGIALVIGRLAHALGLSLNENASPGRAIGVVLTLLVLITTSVRLLLISFLD